MDKIKAELLMRAALQMDVEDRAWTVSSSHLLEFARLVALEEREKCAQLADMLELENNKGIASAIRARGNT